MTRRAAVALAMTALFAACVSAGGSLGAPSGVDGRREERVLVSAFSDVVAVAASERTVFAATRDEVAVYDRQFASWRPPISLRGRLVNGYVTLLAADPVEDAAWIGVPGAVLYARSDFDLVSTAIVAGNPDAVMFDRRNPIAGAYVHSGGQWMLISRTGASLPLVANMLPPAGARLVPSTARDVFERYPSLRGFSALLTRDEALVTWPVSSAAVVPNANEVWLGTRGAGLFKVDPLFNQSQHIPYGLIGRGVGALAIAGDDILVGGIATGEGRGGLTLASRELQRFRWIEGAATRPFARVRVNDIDVHGTVAWIATDRGVARVDLDHDGDVRIWSALDGLPDDRALSVAGDARGAWVGTARGIAYVRDSADVRPTRRGAVSEVVGQGAIVRALLLVGDTLWAGTDRGLVAMRAASPDSALRRITLASDEPRLGRAITALASSDSVLVATTDDAVIAIDLRHGRLMPSLEATNIASLRGVASVAVDGRAIWLAGRGGVVVIDRVAGASRLLANGVDLPNEALAVRLDATYAWIGTRDGLLRIRRTPAGLAP